MSGLFGSLSVASQALIAQTMGLDVTGQNISNLATPGYSRRSLVLAEVPATGPLSAGGGVSVVEVRALRDQIVEGRLRRAEANTAHDAALAEVLAHTEAILGLPGTGLDADLTALFDAFSALANDPTSIAARDHLVTVGGRLAGSFGNLSNQFAIQQRDANSSIRAAAVEVNELSAELAQLNVEISQHNYDVESLRDRQNILLGRLSELADVAVLSRADGGVDVTLASGRALVIGENSYTLDAPPTGFATFMLGDVDVTAELTGGRIGGLIQARDAILPGYTTQLDQLAYDIATAVNALHATGFDATGAAAGAFFAPLGSVAGAAQSFAVDAALLADSRRVAASSTGAIGDNGIASQLAALRDAQMSAGGTRSAFDAWSHFVYGVGTDVVSAGASASSHGQIVTQMEQLRAQTSGVSYDEEAAHLMRYQRAYEANARFFQTVSDTLDVLMEMVRR